MKLLITGGAGFIGSNLIKIILKEFDYKVLNLDKLTYASNLKSLEHVQSNSCYDFVKKDICDFNSITEVIKNFKPTKIIHLAAESHVDRSIDLAKQFIQTNINGTYNLLEASRVYFENLEGEEKKNFLFHHISTDEVYGSLNEDDEKFTEKSNYDPNSPYSASKASSDHLVRAWHTTYNLPIIITNCSNNYGPFQFPEKLIPLTILKSLAHQKIPVYGDGKQIRDWLYVEDHARAIINTFTNGKVGETYNIGGNCEKTNIEVVSIICGLLDKIVPSKKIKKYSSLISFVKDRPGHDRRYSMDISKINNELNWSPDETFDSGIEKTVKWYLENKDWIKETIEGNYDLERLGLNVAE
tara:strand:- start:1240 stop:2304 length:1065 start_codon:yes stop_codon:yes gene_type:complete